jgi:iron complex outermembrane recepter protein
MTHSISRRRGWMTAASAVALALPALALSSGAAIAADAETGTRIEEVVVTARSRGESVQDIPIAITAITEQLKSADVRDIRDIVAFTPNVRIDSIYQRANAPSINIRGISPSRTDDNSIDSPIGVLIDGIYLGSLPGQIIDNFDLERVEILRGPQGTLFGRNTVGGALNVIRTEPTGKWGAKVQYTTGKWNDQEFRGVLNAPLIADVLAAKLFFISANRDGYLHNTFLNINQPQKDYANYGVVLKWTPNDTFKALLTVEKYDDKSQGGAFLGNYNVPPGVLPPATGPSDINAPGSAIGPGGGVLSVFLPGVFGLQNAPPRTDLSLAKTINDNFPSPGSVQTYAYTLNMSQDLSDKVKLVSVTGYRKQHELASEDFDGSSADFITISTDARYHQFSQELRLEGDWDTGMGNVSFVAGGYFYSQYFKRKWVTGGDFWTFVPILSGYNLATNTWGAPGLAAATGFADPISACLAPRTTPTLNAVFGRVQCDPGVRTPYGAKLVNKLYETQKTDSLAGFAHADWQFATNLTLTAGLRYTWERKHFVGYQSYLLPANRVDVDVFPGNADLTNSWEQVTPMAALSYKMTPDILWYASYSQGWHSGGFFGVNQNAADFVQNQYKPEKAKSWELGMKGQFFDNTVQFNVAAFLNDFSNKQESAIVFDKTTNTVVTLFTNVGGLRYKGLEAELQWVVTPQFNVAASFGYIDAKYTDLMIGYPGNKSGAVPIVNATFLTPRNVPKFTAGGAANYTIPIGPGDLTLGSKITWVDSVYGDLYNASTSFIPSHTDISASASYTYDNYKVTVFGRNLTNWRREAPVFIAPLFAASTITPGASWGVELQAEF